MFSFVRLITFTVCFVFTGSVLKAEPEPGQNVRGYDYKPPPSYLPPTPSRESQSALPGCNQCRPTQQCTTELDIRDETVPKEVRIPTLDYQIHWQSKPVYVVTDFDVRENPRPVILPLQDRETRTEPRIREVEKIVKVRVPRIKENVIVKKIDRVRLVPQYQRKSKPIQVQHVRQVPTPYIVQVPKTVVQKKYTPEVVEVPVPVRIANVVDVTENRIDKPIELPSIQYHFCEKIQEIQVKANCPTTPTPIRIPTATPRPTYLPPLLGTENDSRSTRRNTYKRRRRAHVKNL